MKPSWANLPSLAWRTVTSSNSSKFGVKGTVLASALYGPQSRWAIEEVRTLDEDRQWSTAYRLRDAHGVTDAEIREGKSSPVVCRGDLHEIFAFIEKES